MAHQDYVAVYDAIIVNQVYVSICHRAGGGAAAAGLPSPGEVTHDPKLCQSQIFLKHEALPLAHLPIRKKCVPYLPGMKNDMIKGAASIAYHTLVPGHVIAASARANP